MELGNTFVRYLQNSDFALFLNKVGDAIFCILYWKCWRWDQELDECLNFTVNEDGTGFHRSPLQMIGYLSIVDAIQLHNSPSPGLTLKLWGGKWWVKFFTQILWVFLNELNVLKWTKCVKSKIVHNVSANKNIFSFSLIYCNHWSLSLSSQ